MTAVARAHVASVYSACGAAVTQSLPLLCIRMNTNRQNGTVAFDLTVAVESFCRGCSLYRRILPHFLQ